MKKNDVLFKQTVIRVGFDNMRGVERLIEDGYHGLAEKQTVAKLFGYIRTLEKKCGIDIPKIDAAPIKEGMLKINQGGITYYAPSGSGA